ncbi:hypothetical protein GRF29_8g184836 [Pseudopithomyces chartarum]|uniref:Uncharacterized protein n=1 Tax=Pseudopithomyces chartarum TaxID=1892770 RepID=A0AAN6RLJ8_9PLEO|nr:hypothetical protein GRF29_8g184836 [Pseudopithomyces chartarum]
MELDNPVGLRYLEAAIETHLLDPLAARFRRRMQHRSDECLRQALNYTTIAREIEYLHKKLKRPVGISDIVRHFIFSHEEGIKSCDRTALIAFSAKIDCLISAFNKTHRRDYGTAGYQNAAPWHDFLREVQSDFEHRSIWALIELISDEIGVAQTNAEDFEYALCVLGSAWSYYKNRDLSLYRHASVR